MNPQHSIAVFGEALVDDFGSEQVVGGAPFNLARNLAAFGMAPLMITRIGRDGNGAKVLAEFERFGMRVDGVQSDLSEPTGRVVVEREAGGGGHRFTILPDQAYDHIEPGPALAALHATAPAMLYFGTLAQRRPTSYASLQALLAATPAKRFLDLNVRQGQVSERCVYESLRQADIVKVNEEELKDLFNWYTHTSPGTDSIDAPAPRAACAMLIRIFALEGLVVTLGPRGAAWFGADGDVVLSPGGPPPGRLVDSVGAGDAFAAVFLYGRAQDWPLALTLARANDFAGAVCAIAGAVAPQLAFYESWLARWQASGSAT